jgi:hypothetical protein
MSDDANVNWWDEDGAWTDGQVIEPTPVDSPETYTEDNYVEEVLRALRWELNGWVMQADFKVRKTWRHVDHIVGLLGMTDARQEELRPVICAKFLGENPGRLEVLYMKREPTPEEVAEFKMLLAEEQVKYEVAYQEEFGGAANA